MGLVSSLFSLKFSNFFEVLLLIFCWKNYDNYGGQKLPNERNFLLFFFCFALAFILLFWIFLNIFFYLFILKLKIRIKVTYGWRLPKWQLVNLNFELIEITIISVIIVINIISIINIIIIISYIIRRNGIHCLNTKITIRSCYSKR